LFFTKDNDPLRDD